LAGDSEEAVAMGPVMNGRSGPRLDPNHADHSWRLWVTNHPIGAALLSGFVATHIATLIGYFFGGVGLPQFIWPIVYGRVVLPHASATAQFVVGEVFIHGMDGVVFTLIYAVVLFPLFSKLVGYRVNPATNMARAVLFSLILGTISAGFLTPYVYEAGAHAGVFSTGLGWKVPLAIYLWHLAYGVNLGMMYNPLGAQDEVVSGTAVQATSVTQTPDAPVPSGSTPDQQPTVAQSPS
jgi:hypothetical protein